MQPVINVMTAPPVPPDEYCLFFIQWWPMCMAKGEWASWAQAFFSVAAIVASVFLVHRQHRLAEESRLRQANQNVRDAVEQPLMHYRALFERMELCRTALNDCEEIPPDIWNNLIWQTQHIDVIPLSAQLPMDLNAWATRFRVGVRQAFEEAATLKLQNERYKNSKMTLDFSAFERGMEHCKIALSQFDRWLTIHR